MGLFDTIFGGKKKETSTTEQSGDTKYGLTPEVLDYWKSISGMFDPSQWQGVGPDQYQTDAAGRAAGFVNSLYPAVGTAFGIGATGIDPRSISSFMNPYQDEVIRKGLDDMESGHAMERATTMGQAAKLGALSGTNPLVARNLLNQKQGDERSGFISNLRNQGFDKASNLAAQSAQTQLAGLGQMGNLVNQQAGINQGQFGMGTQFWNQGWQNAMMPYQIGQWGSGLLGQLSPYSGQQTHGTSFGNSTTTGTPSPFSVFGNLVGLGANLFSDERVKENVAVIGETFDGQPIYRYNYIGDPRTTIGLMAQDVEQTNPEAVGEVDGIKVVDYDRALSRSEPRQEAMANGGSVGGAASDPHAKFRSAFDAVSGLIAKARGGSVMPPYADGGAIPSWNTPLPIELEAPKAPAIGSWETTVTPASGMDWKKLAEGVSKAGADNGPDLSGGRSPLADQQASLSRFLASSFRGAPAFDDGGVVREWGEQGPIFSGDDVRPSGLTPPVNDTVDRVALGEVLPTSERMSVAPAAAPSSPDKAPRGGWLGKFLPGLNEGHWVGDEATPAQRLGLALMSIRDPMWEGPMNGFARSIGEQQKQRLDRMRVEQAADQFAKQLALQKSTAVGSIDGQPTLEAQRIKQAAAQHQEQLALQRAGLTGVIGGVPTVAGRTADANIANDAVTRAMNEEKLRQLQHPEIIIEQRKKIATDTLGFRPGTPEFNHYVATGELPSKAGAAQETTLQKEIDKTRVDMAEKAINSAYGAKEVVTLVDELRGVAKDPNFQGAVGPVAGGSTYQTVVGRIPGMQSLGLANPELNARIERIQAQLSLAGGEKMKGLGAQSDADAARLEKAISALTSARDKKEFENALSIIEGSVSSAYNRGIDAAREFPALGRGLERLPKREVRYTRDQALQEARDAIGRGANKEKVMQRLRDNGIDPQGL